MKWIPQQFNDALALVLIAVITGMWIVDGRGWVSLPENVPGALIGAFTLVVQFYFRKAKGEKDE